MTLTQLSLFSNGEDQNQDKRQKKARVRRYERLQRELELKNQDPNKIFVQVESPCTPTSTYTFVDLFSGAGGECHKVWHKRDLNQLLALN